MMVFDETTRSLFPSDLFIQPGEQPPIVRENLGKDMCRWYQAAGLFAGEKPVLRVVDYLATLNPEWVHPMHGGSLTSDVLPGYVHALRTEPFVFDGRVFGRMLPW
jgi:flavorubredoxin